MFGTGLDDCGSSASDVEVNAVMAKKRQTSMDKSASDAGKGFATNAFSSLKTLQDKRKSDDEEKRAARERAEAEARARRLAREREELEAKRSLRFTNEDLTDDSGLSDEEIFAASIDSMDGAEIYDKKFNARELPKRPADVGADAEPSLSLTDEEREFAIFTQEMAITNVQRLKKPQKSVCKTRNKGKYLQKVQALVEKDIVSVDARPAIQESGMRSAYVTPSVVVTHIEKGTDVVKSSDVAEGMTQNQTQLLHNVRRYEARYGTVIALRLRGLALDAALSRFDSFVEACIAAKKPYALVICGKGLGSDGAPVIKEGVIARCRRESRIVEYVPVINEDGDFGSLYVAFCVSP